MSLPLKIHFTPLFLLIGFCIGIFLITFFFFEKLAFPDSEYNFLGETDQIKLEKESPLTQKFTASENNLSQVKILIEKLRLLPGEEILLSLADHSCQTVLVKKSITFLTPEPHTYYRFNFPSIPDSQGKEYCLRITYLSPYDRKSKERPVLEASSEEQFLGKSFFNEGKGKLYQDRTLKMHPAYSNDSFLGNLQELTDRISQYKAPLFKGAGLVILFGIFFLGALILALWIILSKER
ncbi:MAG: hypothetical protein AAB615_03560 [Patescibacteria group bacterium]